MNWILIAGFVVFLVVLVVVTIRLSRDDTRSAPSSPDAPTPPGSTTSPQADVAPNLGFPVPDPLPRGPVGPLAPGMYMFGHLWHWDGREWRSQLAPPPETEPVVGVGTTDDGTLWAVTWDRVYRRADSGWESVHHSPDARLLGLHSAGDRVYVVGGHATILRFDSTGVMAEEVPNDLPAAALGAIWGSPEHGYYAVGGYGLLLHSRGEGRWRRQETGVEDVFVAVWGVSGGGVYAASQDGKLVRSSGDGEWHLAREFGAGLGDVRASAGDVVAVTRTGGVFRARAGEWVEESVDRPTQLTCVAPYAEGLMAGDVGGNLHVSANDGRWHTIAGEGSGSVNVIHGTPDDLWIGTGTFYEQS